MSLRSEGSVLLARSLDRLGLTQEDVAAKCGVSRVMVHHWIAGIHTPSTMKRDLLFALYAIPVAAWTEDPKPVQSTTVASASSASPTVNDLVDRIARQAERSIRELETSAAVTAAERDKRLVSLTSIVQKLRDDVITEKQIAESDAWKRIQSAMVSALKPIPGALDALAKALRSLEQ